MNRAWWKIFACLSTLVVPFLFTGFTAGNKKEAQPKDTAVEVVHDDRIDRSIIKGQLLVTLHKGVKADDLKPIFERLEAKFEIVDRIESINRYTLATDHERLPEIKQRLENHPYVAAAGFNGVSSLQRVFNDPVFKKPKDMPEDKDNWGLLRIKAPDAWDITTGGAVVAVIDSGAMLDHEELVGRTKDPYSFATQSEKMQEGMKKIKYGEKFYRDEDVRNHGTHVAITIGGKADNGVGTAGMAPNSPIMPLQALFSKPVPMEPDAQTPPRGFDNAISQAMVMALDKSAAVMNMSIGGVSDDLKNKWRAATTDEERETIGNQFLAQADDHLKNNLAPILDRANRQGSIVVVAAGNDDLPAEYGSYALSRRVISVAATTRADHRCNFTNYADLKRFGWGSNYGPYTTVSAPGHDIWSGWADAGKPYHYNQGTSMACPHTAGVVALMKTIDPGLKFADVAAILIKTGRVLDTDQPIGPLINAKAALEETRRRLEQKIREPELPPFITPPAVNPTLPGLPDDGIAILRRPNPWNDPDVQRIIRVWLAFATPLPPAGTDPNVRFFFNLNGQAVNNRTVLTAPRPIWFQSNFRWLWENANKLDSTNMGSLYEFTVGTMRLRKFDPVATRVPGNVRPRKDDPKTPAPILPPDAGFGKTKWSGKNVKGEAVKVEFNDKAVTITRDGKPARYRVHMNAYVQPARIDFFPEGGGDPIRGLVQMNHLGEIALRTDFTKVRPAKFASDDPLLLALKREDAAVKILGFGDGDGKEVDPRFADAHVCDGTTGDAGKIGRTRRQCGLRRSADSDRLHQGQTGRPRGRPFLGDPQVHRWRRPACLHRQGRQGPSLHHQDVRHRQGGLHCQGPRYRRRPHQGHYRSVQHRRQSVPSNPRIRTCSSTAVRFSFRIRCGSQNAATTSRPNRNASPIGARISSTTVFRPRSEALEASSPWLSLSDID